MSDGSALVSRPEESKETRTQQRGINESLLARDPCRPSQNAQHEPDAQRNCTPHMPGYSRSRVPRSIGEHESERERWQSQRQSGTKNKICRLTQRWPLHARNLENRHQNNQPDWQMQQRRMKPPQKLKPVPMRLSIQPE